VAEVTLYYASAPHELWSYAIEVDGEAGKPVFGVPYETMMRHFSQRVIETDAERAFTVSRQSGLMQYVQGDFRRPLGQELFQLLRKDVAEFIRAMSPAPRVVMVNSRVQATSTVALQLRTGLDTVACAVGEHVLVRVRAGLVEDPYTGRWLDAAQVPMLVEESLVGLAWGKIPTQQLLQSGSSRFYLHGLGGWVTLDTLLARYEQYEQEKDNAELCK